jgi:hypothetical protein
MRSPNTAPLLAGQVIGPINDAFVVAEWRDPGGPPSPPRLIAPRQEGTLCVQVGEHEVEARAGSAVFVPRRTRAIR